MANPEQLKILQQGVEAWNAWREDNPDERIDLREANPRLADLSGVNLSDADLSRADLSDADLPGANLRRACLRGADLSGAYLRESRLTGADLVSANLIQANLAGAHLKRADLFGANAESANLNGADLAGASLSGADLREAQFIEAHLTHTKLTEARLQHATFGFTELLGLDLGEVDGLEKAAHAAASNIDIETIRKSLGKIPTSFLRGCGLSDLEIEFAKLAAPGLDSDQVTQIVYEMHRLYCDQPIQFYSCFISYSSKDQGFAQRLHNDLQNSGVRCWFAPEDMKIGDEFRRAIGKEIRVRDKLLLVLSENSIHSEWVGDEVEKALSEEKAVDTLKLFPIRIDNAVFEAKDDWAEKIRLRRHIGDFASDYAKGLARLLRDLKPQDAEAEAGTAMGA